MNQLNQGPNPNLHLRYSRFTEHLLTVQNLGLDKNAFKGKKKKKKDNKESPSQTQINCSKQAH